MREYGRVVPSDMVAVVGVGQASKNLFLPEKTRVTY